MVISNVSATLNDYLNTEFTLQDEREVSLTPDKHEQNESSSEDFELGLVSDSLGQLGYNTNWNPVGFDGWGDPLEDAAYWHQQEANYSCAVVAQISVYESITGIEISEAAACEYAEANDWYDPQGGTSPAYMGSILESLGIATEQYYNATLDDITFALNQGDKVMVGLDGNEIWNPISDPFTGQPLQQQDAGHAVWVTGIDPEPDGSYAIILNDSGHSGGQMVAVDALDFLKSWSDYNNFLVVADVPGGLA